MGRQDVGREPQSHHREVLSCSQWMPDAHWSESIPSNRAEKYLVKEAVGLLISTAVSKSLYSWKYSNSTLVSPHPFWPLRISNVRVNCARLTKYNQPIDSITYLFYGQKDFYG